MKKIYKSIALLVPLLLFGMSLNAQTMMPMPPHNSVYSAMARGFWFVAPTSFTITGLRVPSEAGTGAQYIHVMKCHDPFPVSTSGSTNFTTLTYINGAPNGVIQSVNIQVAAGDTIGILGTAGTANSYTSSAVHTSTIAGFTVNINRLGYQGDINTGPAPNYWGVADGASGSISRVEVYYTTAPCTTPPVAGSASASPSSGICIGTPVQLSLTGNSFGSGQTYVWEESTSPNGPWTAATAPLSSPFATVSPTVASYYRAAVTCSGQTVYSDSVLISLNPYLAGGNYTINSAQPTSGNNFASFSDAVAAMACGIGGPIVIDVVPGSGPYVEKVTIPQIGNTSSTNTITINGNGEELTFNNTNSGDRGILTLDGTDHLTVDSLVVTSTGTYGFGIVLTNSADSNSILNCVVNVDTAATGSQYAGITLSGSTSSATSAGSNSNGNLIDGNTVNGGYYGITIHTTIDNVVSNNEVSNFYLYGIYSNDNTRLLLEANDVHRTTRSLVSSFYGIYQTGTPVDNRISRNRIHDAFTGNSMSTSLLYGIYITSSDAAAGDETIVDNNLLYALNGGGTIYAMYNAGSNNVHYLHNSISIDDAGYTGSGIARGLYQTTSASGIEFRNNIVYNIRGGTGTNHGVYFNTSSTSWSADNNVYYIAGSGTNYIGRDAGTNHTTLAAWQSATGNDTASFEESPGFAGLPVGDLTPTNGNIDDQGVPVGITIDVLNNPRSATTPDIGAYEFSIPACIGFPVAGTATGPASVCLNESFVLSLSGYTIGQGISIQWEYFDMGAFQWLPIANATTPNYTVTGQTQTTDYRAQVTCINGGFSDVSAPLTVAMSPFYDCYCTSNATSASNEEIWGVSVGLLNNVTDCSTGTLMYNDYTNQTPPNLPQNTTVPITLTLGTCGSSSTSLAAVYIDFNQDGDFDDTGEDVFYTTPVTSSGAPGQVEVGNINVPATAMLGITGMRVVYERTTSSANINPCGTYTYGETEDYRVNIVPPPTCLTPGVPSVNSITFSTAEVEWGQSTSGPALGYEWRVFTAGNGPLGTAIVSGIEAAGDTIANITGLSGVTDYSFYVRAICTPGDTSSWVGVNFLTPCAPYTAPYFHDVEVQTPNTNATVSACWTADPSATTSLYRWNVSASNTPSTNTGPGSAYSGSNFFYTEASSGSTGSVADLITPEVDVTALTTPQLEFYYHMWGPDFDRLVISVSDDGINWNPVDSLVGQQQAAQSDPWMKRSVVLSGYTGTIQVKFTAIRGTGFGGDHGLDDIAIVEAPTCISVMPVVLTSTATSAVVDWNSSVSNPANGYEWRVFPQGNGPSGTPISSGTEPAGDTVANISGLTATTDYSFWVRALCSSTDSSYWTQATFTTPCASVAAPFVESFDGTTTPSCWSNTGLEEWKFSTSAGYDAGNAGDHTGNSGNYAWVDGSTPNNSGTTLTTPLIDISGLTSPWLRYYLYSNNTNSAANNEFIVQVLDGTSWITIDSVKGNLGSAWDERTAVLTGLSSNMIQIRFIVNEESSVSSAFHNDILIDDINVEQAPACIAPGGLAVTNLTSTTADVTWNAVVGASSGYEYAVDTDPSPAPNVSTTIQTSASATPPTVTGLSPTTTYYLHVRSNCGTTNGYSAWVVYSFNTRPVNDSCVNAINISSGQPFTGTTAGASESMPSGSCATSTNYANDVWYYFNTGSQGNVTVTATNTVGDVVLEVFDGTCGSFTSLDCQDQPAIGMETATLNNLPAGTYYVRVYGFLSAEGPFEVQVSGTPLAVDLTEISATNVGSRNRVDWATSSEAAGDYFIVQRSKDGRNFSDLGTVMANGQPSSYSFWDESPFSGVNHYRLKMHDANGQFGYSILVQAIVREGGAFSLQAFPNPVKDLLTVTISGGADNGRILITDVAGKVVRSVNVTAESMSIDMSQLADGMYMLQYVDDHRTETLKVNKH